VIAAGEVHIWSVELDRSDDCGAELDAAERERAARFRLDEVRRRYVAGHAALRRILARYAGVPAGALRFAKGEHGKPYLPGSPLRFNMSDSGKLALYAVTLESEVGVDVERIRPMGSAASIAARFLPAPEADAVRLDPLSFFRVWTRREAYLKCIGVGLRRIGEAIPPGYFIADLDPAPGYVGAVVWEGGERRIVMRSAERP
jgi:4'-phosphopantetheinyl transferase